MAEALKITQDATKDQIYEEILPQIRSLIGEEENLTANLANIAAVIKTAFGHLWVGFYVLNGEDLVLGPFQGPIACTRIPLVPVARRVCGAAAVEKKTIIVPDVEKFPGHIACSNASRSEIVIPLVINDKAQLVLDIDSEEIEAFDAIDQLYCEQIIEEIKQQHF